MANSLLHYGISLVLTVKHYGYRAMLRSDGRSVRLFTRRNYDWTERFPAFVGTARALRARSFLIDGEAVCFDETGTPLFEMLRQRRNEARVFLYAFDLLQLDRRDMRREPIEVRKLELAKLIGGAGPGLQLDGHDGAIVFEHACNLGLEGIVPKREVPMPGTDEQVLGGHCVMAVGYDDQEGKFICRNSWGTSWGDEGYFYMPYAYLLDNNLSDDFWTIRLVE